MPSADRTAAGEERFRRIFRGVHADHPACLADEWLSEPCRTADGRLAARPVIWSRRNGPWRRSPILWVGAAPGNAGGKGKGQLGAHGTRIPFGGDIAGANLDVLLSSIGLDRNHTFITASLNALPARGGGEPTAAEILAPVGAYPDSLHITRDTMIAVGPTLIVALGNLALRCVVSAARVRAAKPGIVSLARLQGQGMLRNVMRDWPAALPPDEEFLAAWHAAWPGAHLPGLLWLTHPSAQNMSPYAGESTLFHGRMREAQEVLRNATHSALGLAIPAERPHPPDTGIYALPEWRDLIAPRFNELDLLWRAKGI